MFLMSTPFPTKKQDLSILPLVNIHILSFSTL